MDINELVNLAKEGDSDAFAKIYDMYAQKIFRFVRLKIQNRHEAEDLVQDVFIKAYRSLGTLADKDLNFSAWLYKISLNTINDNFRKKYRTPIFMGIDEHFDVPSMYSLQGEAEQSSELETVKTALKHLSPRHREVLELRFVQDFTVDETAEIIGKSNLSVRLLQFRALKKLKHILTNNNGSDNKKYSKEIAMLARFGQNSEFCMKQSRMEQIKQAVLASKKAIPEKSLLSRVIRQA